MSKLRVFAMNSAGDHRSGGTIAWVRHYLVFLGLGIVLGITIAGAGPALSALPSGSAVTTAASYGSTFVVGRPVTTAAGDILIASLDVRLDSVSITAPTGWRLIRQDSNPPGYDSLTQATYYKAAG